MKTYTRNLERSPRLDGNLQPDSNRNLNFNILVSLIMKNLKGVKDVCIGI